MLIADLELEAEVQGTKCRRCDILLRPAQPPPINHSLLFPDIANTEQARGADDCELEATQAAASMRLQP